MRSRSGPGRGPTGGGGGRDGQRLLEPAGLASEGEEHLCLSTKGVETEQVASRRDLGLSPSEQGRAGGYFLGLQVLGGFQPWEGRWEEKMEMQMEMEIEMTSPARGTPSQAVPVVKVMLAGEVRLGPRRPRTVAV